MKQPIPHTRICTTLLIGLSLNCGVTLHGMWWIPKLSPFEELKAALLKQQKSESSHEEFEKFEKKVQNSTLHLSTMEMTICFSRYLELFSPVSYQCAFTLLEAWHQKININLLNNDREAYYPSCWATILALAAFQKQDMYHTAYHYFGDSIDINRSDQHKKTAFEKILGFSHYTEHTLNCESTIRAVLKDFKHKISPDHAERLLKTCSSGNQNKDRIRNLLLAYLPGGISLKHHRLEKLKNITFTFS